MPENRDDRPERDDRVRDDRRDHGDDGCQQVNRFVDAGRSQALFESEFHPVGQALQQTEGAHPVGSYAALHPGQHPAFGEDGDEHSENQKGEYRHAFHKDQP
ncbi:Uncharacterised protein [Mycobacteroides abscessus subsp. abscessus]|nr:Uncharacterised protein [Mycobacteroides abscessus subsp. abscessus]SIL74096.1 Uncharacterised protein [Mycobacteroides abscessus subsp. abscessus]SIN32528.1 Uncharacterised protein [Mycobacteroides abscessus subsp. abscessus]